MPRHNRRVTTSTTDRATDFRCSVSSRDDHEEMAGTAPTETDLLFVEYAGAWGRKAVAESRLPGEVVAHLESLAGVRVQLVRRHGGLVEGGVRVFAATLGAGAAGTVTTALLDDVRDLPDLAPADLQPYAGPLWLVCTNGRRDLCCAESGRPVATALASRWPEATWETTHLGGHRFAGTLLALPSGVTLGRLDPHTAVEACRELEHGRLPLDRTRGVAGRPGPAQVAELFVRRELGLTGLGEVTTEGADGDRVVVRAGAERYDVTVSTATGEPRRQSCADLSTKPAQVYAVTRWVRLT